MLYEHRSTGCTTKKTKKTKKGGGGGGGRRKRSGVFKDSLRRTPKVKELKRIKMLVTVVGKINDRMSVTFSFSFLNFIIQNEVHRLIGTCIGGHHADKILLHRKSNFCRYVQYVTKPLSSSCEQSWTDVRIAYLFF